MGNKLKKSIAFYCCSNGYGHFRRVVDIASLLKNDLDVTIYCTVEQFEKFDQPEDIVFVVSHRENINWKKALEGKTAKVIDDYFEWVEVYGDSSQEYDIVVSDNMPGLLGYRQDFILLGSFFWKDVFLSAFGENRLTEFDQMLIDKYNPTVITNKYVETQSMRNYSNKLQFGFGCKSRRKVLSDIKYNLVNKSSLKYIESYKNFIENTSLEFVDDFNYIDNTIMFARPGVGTITHCVENYLPLVALYDKNDSQEILELAQVVEDLNLGFKQDVSQPLDQTKLKLWNSNSKLLYGTKLEIDAYSSIAEFLKNYA